MIKIPRPNCGRKGLHYASHPHAFGYKDYERVECRFCKKKFHIERKIHIEDTDADNSINPTTTT